MSKDRSTIRKVLFITLSNLGDVILTLPVLDAVRERFPGAHITVMVGPRARELFQDNPAIQKLIIFDKHIRLRAKIALFRALAVERFDLVLDMRNTLYGALLPARFRTCLLSRVRGPHSRQRNLERFCHALGEDSLKPSGTTRSMAALPEDRAYIDTLLRENGISCGDRVVLVSPIALGATKRWSSERFIELCRELTKNSKVVLIGVKEHQEVSSSIVAECGNLVDLTGMTTLRQLTALFSRAALLVTADSGTMHLASYLDTPIVALFGPTDDARYGPWSSASLVVKKEIFCRPCGAAQCRYGTIDCMKLITVPDVLVAVESILSQRPAPPQAGPLSAQTSLAAGGSAFGADKRPAPKLLFPDLKRILIIRTDRMGDMLLSTPAIQAMRAAYPNAYIAMMVSPYARDIVEGNPFLDEVIAYDKDNAHKHWLDTVWFAGVLRKKGFDAALIIHPINRAHLAVWLAGIPRRIGLDCKMGFLLTDRIPHIKQHGQKHEREYVLDMVRYLGIEPRAIEMYMPIKAQSEAWVGNIFAQEGIRETDAVIAIHPAASCPSRMWPVERFAAVADILIKKYACKVIIVSGGHDRGYGELVARNMLHPAVNLAGRTTVSQLASVLKRSRLLISNISGPAHMASAVGTPVIAIFSCAQPGLSPRRWGPMGTFDRVVHKSVGCVECRAHDCVRQFECLRAISVEDIVRVADDVLTRSKAF